MKFFVKRRHVSPMIGEIILSIMVCIGIYIDYLGGGSSFRQAMVGVSLVMLFLVLSYMSYRTWGLHIEGQQIYHKNLLKHPIAVGEIAAIKICRAQLRCAEVDDIPLIDRHGNPLYSMILLKEYDSWERVDKPMEDTDFCRSYREDVICYTIYDQAAIDYLKTLNPDILVIPASGGIFTGAKPGGKQHGWITSVDPKQK